MIDYQHRNQALLDDFVAYCRANPTQRFWQALRNWSGFAFIHAEPVGNRNRERDRVLIDTFHFEGKDG